MDGGFRYFNWRLHRFKTLRRFQKEICSADVGETIWSLSFQTLGNSLFGKGDPNVWGSNGRWLTERPRDQRVAAIGCKRFDLPYLLLHRGHHHGSPPLRERW